MQPLANHCDVSLSTIATFSFVYKELYAASNHKKKPENNKIYKENRKNKMSLVKDHQKPLQMIHKHENVSLVFKKLSNI